MIIMRCDRCRNTDEKGAAVDIVDCTLRLESTVSENGILTTICKVDLCEPCRKTFKQLAMEFCSKQFSGDV